MNKFLLLPTLLIMAACGSTPAPQTAETTETSSGPTMIDTTAQAPMTDAASGATNVENGLILNGTMTLPPQSNITVSLPIGGIVSSFSLLPGSYVQKGQTIAVLENTEFIDLQQGYLDAAAQVEFLETEYRRQKSLAENDVTSAKRLQQSKAEYLSANSRKEAFGAKLSILGVAPAALAQKGIVAQLTVTAPQSGYVSDIMVNPGLFVAMGEPICRIINKSEILLQLTAYEKDLDQLTIDQKITFRANGLGSELFSATVTAIDQRVDPVNRSVKVYARVQGTHPRFRPGMYVMAMI